MTDGICHFTRFCLSLGAFSLPIAWSYRWQRALQFPTIVSRFLSRPKCFFLLTQIPCAYCYGSTTSIYLLCVGGWTIYTTRRYPKHIAESRRDEILLPFSSMGLLFGLRMDVVRYLSPEWPLPRIYTQSGCSLFRCSQLQLHHQSVGDARWG